MAGSSKFLSGLHVPARLKTRSARVLKVQRRLGQADEHGTGRNAPTNQISW